MLLNHYLLCCFTLQGALLLFSLQIQPLEIALPQSVLATNIALQPAYCIVLARNWRVNNVLLYLRTHCRAYFVPTPLSFLATLTLYAYTGSTSMGLLLYVLLTQYWSEHIVTLRGVNTMLAQI